jgi:aldehyde:ferredoxin oxidoreductase
MEVKMKGYNGKILEVDLNKRTIKVNEHDEKFYRKYMGGSALGGYYLLKNMVVGANPLGPENVMVFATSVVTGTPTTGFSRASINAKSPLTNAIGDSQFGGFWPTCLKQAGFDAIIVKEISSSPVYLWINNGEAEIRDASSLWGLETGETIEIIKKQVNDKTACVLTIGKAGENKVKYASVISEYVFAAGRTGMGAVMGSKNLKAIAVAGRGKKLEFYDETAIRAIAKEVPGRIKNNAALDSISKMGSSVAIESQNAVGGLPTRNFQHGVFDKAKDISGYRIYETISTKKRHTCYGCAFACKQKVKIDQPHDVDEKYGCPEYETAAAFGSYVMVDDINVICKANELCNRHGLDTISAGATIAFIVECYERGLITKDDTDGLELKFGNGEQLLILIEKIVNRDGFGDLLAEGLKAVSEKIDKGSEKFAMHVKGNPFPAHMPRVKQSLALAYAIKAYGADHITVHDPAIDPSTPEVAKTNLRSLGLLEDLPTTSLKGKAKFYYYTQNMFDMFDTLLLCTRE